MSRFLFIAHSIILTFLFLPSFSYSENSEVPLSATVQGIHQIGDGSKFIDSKAIESVRNAAVIIGTGCRGTFISNEGHMLTAAHCLPSIFRAPVRLAKSYFYQVNIDAMENLFAPIFLRLNNNFKNREEVLDGNLLFAGSGYFENLGNPVDLLVNEATRLQTIDLLSKGIGPAGDYAIIHFAGLKTSCLKIADKPPLKGETLFSVGWHGVKDPDLNSYNWKEVISIGTLTGGLNQNNAFQSWKTNVYPSAKTQVLEAIDQIFGSIYDGDKILTSSIEMYPGWSGSAAVNSQGKIVGVNNLLFHPGQPVNFATTYGRSLSASIFSIVESAQSLVGSKSNSWFKCEK